MSKHSATATTGADTTNLIPFKQPTGGGKCYAGLHHSGDPESLAALAKHIHLHLPRLPGLQDFLERSQHSTWNWELVSSSGSANIRRNVNLLFRQENKVTLGRGIF